MTNLTLTEYLEECSALFKTGEEPLLVSSSVGSVSSASDRIATLRVSTPNVDRKGHIVLPEGGDLTAFKKNPLFMWNHLGYSDPTKIIGKVLSITQSDEGIDAVVRYASFSSNPLADHLWELETKGMLPANSIGIRPLGNITKDEKGIYTIGRWELLDVSKVAIGMNPHAVNTVA